MRKMLSHLQRQIEILNKRRNNLKKKMEQIDDLPNNEISNDTYRQWHEIYIKVNFLDLRIQTIQSKMEILQNKNDIIRSVISGSKGLFRNLIGGNK